MRLVVIAVIAAVVLGPGPAGAKRAATHAACVERCDATTGDCISAAGGSVSKKTERRCRRRTLRRCMRTGLDACRLPDPPPPDDPDPPPPDDPCPATPNIVGTWESADVTCVQNCLVPDSEPVRFEERPCEPAEQPPFRITVSGQGKPCDLFSITQPFDGPGLGFLDLAATPITFKVWGPGSIPAPARSWVQGAIEGDTLTGVTMSSGNAQFPPGCSTGLTVGPMTRVARD